MRLLCAIAYLAGFVRGYIKALFQNERCELFVEMLIGFLLGHFVGPFL